MKKIQFVRDNPLPFALAGLGVGLGIAYLIARRPKTTAQKLAGMAEDAKESIVDAGHAASKKLTHLSTSAEDTFKEHPLLVGAGLLAVGAAVAKATAHDGHLR